MKKSDELKKVVDGLVAKAKQLQQDEAYDDADAVVKELETARREIAEETGYEGEDFVDLGPLVPTGAYDTEVIEMYYAKAGRYVGQHFDFDENLALSLMTLDQIIDEIMEQKIIDAKTIAMAFKIREMKNRK